MGIVCAQRFTSPSTGDGELGSLAVNGIIWKVYEWKEEVPLTTLKPSLEMGLRALDKKSDIGKLAIFLQM